jgi:putative inorganic carbon (HCO3(-)) transporter
LRSKLQYLFKWVDRLHWLWLGLAAPFLFFITIERLPAMLVVPGIWLLHWAIGDYGEAFPKDEPATTLPSWPLPATPLNVPILLITLMLLVSTWATYDMALSLPKISGMVLGLGIYFTYARIGARAVSWWIGLLTFLSMGLGITVLGLLGTRWFVEKVNFLSPIINRIPTVITGLQGAETGFHPNEVAGALTWVLPLFLALAIYDLLPRRPQTSRGEEPRSAGPMRLAARLSPGGHWRVRVLLWLGTILAAGVLVLTQSRSGYIGMAAALYVMLLISLPRRWRQIALVIVLIAALITGITLLTFDNLRIWDWKPEGQVLGEGLLSTNSLDSRRRIWSRAIYGLQDFPFTGMGMNAFREVVNVLYPLSQAPSGVNIAHAHNEFLQAGLDLGIPGLIGFVALYMIAFWMSGRIWKLARCFEPAERALQRAIILGLGGGLLAHMFYGMTDAVALGAKPGFLFWVLLGLITGNYIQIGSPLGGDREVGGTNPNYDPV